MKVLQVLYSGLGGHGAVFNSMLEGDKEKEIRYEIIFFGVEEVRSAYIENAERNQLPWHFIKKKPGDHLGPFRAFKKIIHESAPDIIFLHTSAYIFFAKWAVLTSRRKCRIIVRETQANHLKTRKEWIGLFFALLLANKVVFLSQQYSETVQQKFRLFFTFKRTVIIPNGIDMEVYKPMASTQRGTIRIGMQSRLTPIKDHDTLLRAFSQLLKTRPGCEDTYFLLIAGDGSHLNHLKELTKSLGIEKNCTFLGMLEEKDLPAFINSLDIYVHATLGETMSTAIMQVMACRKPIIASDVPGVNNMIKQGTTGLLVPAKNEQAMMDAISFLIDNPAEALRLSTNGLIFASKNFSNIAMMEKYKSIFKE